MKWSCYTPTPPTRKKRDYYEMSQDTDTPSVRPVKKKGCTEWESDALDPPFHRPTRGVTCRLGAGALTWRKSLVTEKKASTAGGRDEPNHSDDSAQTRLCSDGVSAFCGLLLCLWAGRKLMHDVDHGRLILPRFWRRIRLPNFLQKVQRPLVILEPWISAGVN